MRILIEKATKKILEMQSDATAGTLIANAVIAGYSENDIEEKEVNTAQYEEAKSECPVYQEMAKEERKAKIKKEQAEKKAKADIAEVIDDVKIDAMNDINDVKKYLKKLVKVMNIKTAIMLLALFIALPSWGADIKISALPTVTDTTPASDVIPIVASGATSKITVANFLKNYQPLITYPVTGLASPTAGYLVKWGVSGNTLDDGFKYSTMTDSKWCKFTTADGLICNSDEPTGGTGDVATDSIWTSAGDLAYATANDTATVLPLGTAYQLLMTNSGATAPVWSSTLGATGTRLTHGYFTDVTVTNAIAGSVTGNAATATALAANPTDCGTGTLATTIDASGNLTCTATPALGTAGSVVGSLSFANATSGSIKLQPITGALGTTVVNLGTTYTDTKYCTYGTSTGLTCNAEGGGTGGDVATDTIWDSAGDIVQGAGADTATKLTKGATGTILRAGSSYLAYTTSTFADTYTKGSVLYAGTANTITGLAHPGAANRLFYTTGTDGVGWLTSSADVVSLLGSANNAAIKTALGYYTSGDASTFSGVTITKSSGVPGRSLLYEANSIDTNGVGWQGPDNRSSNLYLKFPDADPTTGQVLVCGAPADGVSTCAWGANGTATGDMKADGTVAWTAAPVPNAANTVAIGSTSTEWSDIYLGDGAVAYFGNDQDVTLTHVPDTGLTTNLNFTAATLTSAASATPNMTFFDSDNAGADEETAKILVNAETTTDGAEDGKMSLQVMVGGTDTTYFALDGKLHTATLTPPLTMSANPRIYDGDSHYVTLDVADIAGDATLLLGSTFTNGQWCSFSSTTGLNCNENAPAGSGDITAVGSCTTGSCATIGNGATSAGYIDLLEDSDNGTNYARIQAPASTADVVLTLPAVTDTLAVKGANTFTALQTMDATAGVQVGATGVLITSDDDGAIILTGASAGSDENLIINLDDTANTAVISSTTDVAAVSFSALNLVTTGTVSGKIPMISKTSAYTLGTDNAQEAYGYMVWLTGDGTVLTLPAVSAGMSVCVYSADSYDKVVDPNGSDGIRNGTTTRNADGHKITSGATDQGSFVCLVADSADGWTVLGKSGTWTDE